MLTWKLHQSVYGGADILQFDEVGGHVYTVHVYICDVHLYVHMNFYMYIKIGWQYQSCLNVAKLFPYCYFGS